MRSFEGVVFSGYRYASGNLKGVMHLIEERMGLSGLVDGTLNVRIAEEYIVKGDSVISREECGLGEAIKLKRCVIFGRKAIIMRPEKHETIPGFGHGKTCLELMGCVHFRDTFGLADGSHVTVEVEGDGRMVGRCSMRLRINSRAEVRWNQLSGRTVAPQKGGGEKS
jgi:CTP-dependent riboflavin kinase